jgi:vacuolar-type H+-ATPase subunit E/Vma4
MRREQHLAEARAQADEIISQRRAAAERLATVEERERLARARAEARGRVLRAQQAVFAEATASARRAVSPLIEDPRYKRLLGLLEVEARRRLGRFGRVQIVPAAEGGFLARAGSREIDYSLDAQLQRCLRSMASELGSLWC